MHISGMPPLLTRVFDVPAAARARLESWVQEFRAKVDKARGEWLLSLGIRESRSLQTRRFRIGTDCSGADAPVWALRAMQVCARSVAQDLSGQKFAGGERVGH